MNRSSRSAPLTPRERRRSSTASSFSGRTEDILAVEAQFLDRFADVVQDPVGIVLFTGHLGGRAVPASGELLDRADVDRPVMQVGFEFRHVFDEKAPVLPDRVAAQGRRLLPAVRRDEFQHLPLGLFHGHLRRAALFGQAGLAVVVLAPGLHRAERLRAVTDRDGRALGDEVELGIRDDRADLEDRADPGIEARHLEIEQDERPFGFRQDQMTRAARALCFAPRTTATESPPDVAMTQSMFTPAFASFSAMRSSAPTLFRRGTPRTSFSRIWP